MGKVHKIGISKNKGNNITDVNEVNVVRGMGIENDRFFKKDNNKRSQITLIELENIIYYNKLYNENIPAINFRRNIITEGIKLNDLLNTEFFVGEVKLKAHDLCRPCKYLQESLNQKSLVKEFLLKGGLRCEILTSGKISIDDMIKK